jgi:hypothetical protein
LISSSFCQEIVGIVTIPAALASGKASTFEFHAVACAIPCTLKNGKVAENQLGDHHDIHLSELLEENQHLKGRLTYLEVKYNKNRNTINNLRDSLAKSGLKPAEGKTYLEIFND